MKIIYIVLISSLSFTAIAHAPKSNSNSGNNRPTLIKCSSKKERKKICRADTSKGVSLYKQLSKVSCHENWGYTKDHIWVDNGCKARFQLNIF